MAIDLGGMPWIFDAVEQTAASNFPHPVYVKVIHMEAGAAGGTYEVTVSATGRTLTGPITLAANAHAQFVVDDFVEGVYMKTMTDGQILVFHGKPAR